MNIAHRVVSRLQILAVISLAAIAIGAARSDGGIGDERKIPIDQVPAAARAAILKAVGDGRIVDIGEITENGAVVRYEVECTKDGREIDIVVAPDGSPAQEPGPWRSTFNVDKRNLASTGRNPYFILEPGHRIHLAGDEETVIITVLDETREVDGVETRVVEEREWNDGTLVEISRNYFAIDRTTNDVYYFGEDVDVYAPDGRITGHGGAWLSGRDGARFGLIMPEKQLVGDRYYQEFAPGVAMDRAEVVDIHAKLTTPMMDFTECLYIRESSDLERGFSDKWYAPGVGMIGDDDLRIVQVEEPDAADRR